VDETHLEHKDGTDIPHDGTSEKYLVDKEEIFLRAGKGITALEFANKLMAEKQEKAAQERKEKEAKASLLACKHFGCNVRYKEEDNGPEACCYHESPPIFHETAKCVSRACACLSYAPLLKACPDSFLH
jgi:Rieske Fe-S protein